MIMAGAKAHFEWREDADGEGGYVVDNACPPVWAFVNQRASSYDLSTVSCNLRTLREPRGNTIDASQYDSWSICYTLGDIVASLATLSTAAIVQTKLPAYAGEEPAEMATNVEITLVNPKPITASLCPPMRHLRSVGSCFARWRGLAISILFFLPLTVGFLLDTPRIPEHAVKLPQHDDPLALMLMALHILAIPATAALLAFFVLLPASATLARIEAVLLAVDMQPIVPFDTSFAAPGLLSRMLFTAAWRSINRPARLRVLKVYTKMVRAQFVVMLLGMTLMAEVVPSVHLPNLIQAMHALLLIVFAAQPARSSSRCVTTALHILAVPTSTALVAFFVLLLASATLTRIEAALAHCLPHPQYMYKHTMRQGCCTRSRSHL
ncbi:hypothetical protein B0H13DRAFT_2346398 [Mycena leptocephala]|nr:hypothetical protein B0H13DRAFT_2346398 [Mycena leptocephala]